MKNGGAKIKFFSRARKGTLAMGIALMLVAGPQVWAGIMCLCDPHPGREHSCCLAGHHSDAAAEGYSSVTSTKVTPALQEIIQSSPVTVCCILQPQSEPPARLVSAAGSQVNIVPVKSSESLFRLLKEGPAHSFYPNFKGSKPPLYLAFSSLLI